MSVRTALVLILIFGTSAFAQSGRRKGPVAAPTPTPAPVPTPSPTPSLPARSPVTAEKDQDYKCSDDGTLAHLLDPPTITAFTTKEVDVKAGITERTEPKYTRDARRVGVQGVVTLKLLLLPDGKIDRIRVVRRLPYGLTENAILAACEIKFRPATKAGQPVAQWATIDYVFRLAESSIFGP